MDIYIYIYESLCSLGFVFSLFGLGNFDLLEKGRISWTKRSDGLASLKELVAVEIVRFTVKYLHSVLQRGVLQHY